MLPEPSTRPRIVPSAPWIQNGLLGRVVAAPPMPRMKALEPSSYSIVAHAPHGAVLSGGWFGFGTRALERSSPS